MNYLIIVFFSSLLCIYCIYDIIRWENDEEPTKNQSKKVVWFRNGKEVD